MVAWSIYDPYVSKLLSEKLSQSDFVTRLGVDLANRYPFLLEFMQAQGENVGSASGALLLFRFLSALL